MLAINIVIAVRQSISINNHCTQSKNVSSNIRYRIFGPDYLLLSSNEYLDSIRKVIINAE